MPDYIWDSVWFNANLASMNGKDDLGILRQGAIACKDGVITWLGPEAELPAPPQKLAPHIVDVQGRWLLPGFIDCHTHLVYAGNRALEWSWRNAGMSYEDIARRGGGILSTVASTRAATSAELFHSSAVRLEALIREGLTAVEIKSGYGLNEETEIAMLTVARDLGKKYGVTVRTTLLAAHAVPKEYACAPDDYVDLICTKILPKVHSLGLVDAVDAFCETIAFTKSQVERVFSCAADLGLPIKIHAEQLSNQGGALLASRFKALSADHLDYLDEDGVRALADAQMVAVLLPGSSYFLRAKRHPPIALLRQYHVPMAVASNCNPGSSPICSLLAILNMACVIYNLTPHEALMGLTQHAARALGIGHSHGSLCVGKSADWVEWQIDDPVELCYHIGINPRRRMVRQPLMEKVI